MALLTGPDIAAIERHVLEAVVGGERVDAPPLRGRVPVRHLYGQLTHTPRALHTTRSKSRVSPHIL